MLNQLIYLMIFLSKSSPWEKELLSQLISYDQTELFCKTQNKFQFLIPF